MTNMTFPLFCFPPAQYVQELKEALKAMNAFQEEHGTLRNGCVIVCDECSEFAFAMWPFYFCTLVVSFVQFSLSLSL